MLRKFYEDKSMAHKIKIRNKSSVILHGVAPGNVVTVDTDHEGTPLDRSWRNRLRDSKTDDCVEVVEDEPTPAADEQVTVDEAVQDKPVRKRGRKNEE